MTVTVTPNKFRYQGNGVTDTFSFPARVYDEGDITVQILTRATDAIVETLTIDTHYTVTIASNGTASVQITAPTKIPSGTQDIFLFRELDQNQTLSLPTGTVFPAKAVETQLDRSVSLLQDLAEKVDRSVKIPAQSTLTTLEIDDTPDAGKALKWNATADALINTTYDPDEMVALAEGFADDADTARIAAEAAQAAAELAYDNFDDRYLGPKAANPTLDNDGNALLTGAIYFNTSVNEMRVYNGSSWVAVSPTASIPNGDKGDITTFSDGTVWTIDNDAVTFAKMQNIASMRLIGRTDGGSGDPSEVTLIDDDTFATATATNVPSAESVKAYTDTKTVTVTGAVQSTTSGSLVQFTGIPTTVKKIIISFNAVSLSGTDNILIRIGPSSAVETTGYVSFSQIISSSNITSTTGFIVGSAAAASIITGHVTLVLHDTSTNLWTASGVVSNNETTLLTNITGRKSLASPLQRVSILPTGANSFDAGSINITYTY